MKRSVVIDGHKTSVSLEDCFWYALIEEAKRRNMTVGAVVSEIDNRRNRFNLSSHIRIYLFEKATGPRISIGSGGGGGGSDEGFGSIGPISVT